MILNYWFYDIILRIKSPSALKSKVKCSPAASTERPMRQGPLYKTVRTPTDNLFWEMMSWTFIWTCSRLGARKNAPKACNTTCSSFYLLIFTPSLSSTSSSVYPATHSYLRCMPCISIGRSMGFHIVLYELLVWLVLFYRRRGWVQPGNRFVSFAHVCARWNARSEWGQNVSSRFSLFRLALGGLPSSLVRYVNEPPSPHPNPPIEL